MWPSPSDYQDAIQNPRLCFNLPDLREAEVARGSLGLPRVASGNFASVYELRSTGSGSGSRTSSPGRWAVRCFLRPVSDQERRYHAISEYLNAHPLRWLVDFDYHPQGIRTRGGWHPIVTMDWVDGEPLHRHVESLLGNRSSLLALAYQWRGLARDVRAAGLAHGDYQHGNILVTSGELRLVDYDGMFVPAFTGERSPELGRLNYQHPARGAHDYGPELDNFAAFVIYLSLRALALAPDLWEHHDGENLALTAADFRDPASSKALARMHAIEDAEVRALAGQFGALCAVAPCDVPPLETLLATAAPAWFIGRPAEASERRPNTTTNDQRPTTNDQTPTTSNSQLVTNGNGPEWWTGGKPDGERRPTGPAPAGDPAAGRPAEGTPPGAGARWWTPDDGTGATAPPGDVSAAAGAPPEPVAAPAAGSAPAGTLSAPGATAPAAVTSGPSLAASPAAPGGPSLAAPTEAKLARPQPAAQPAPSKPKPISKPKPTAKPKPAAKPAAPASRPAGLTPAPPSPRRAATGGALLAMLLTAAGGLQYQTLTARVGPWTDLRTATRVVPSSKKPPSSSTKPAASVRATPPSAAAPAAPARVYRGRVLLPADVTGKQVAYVVFRLDGQIAFISDRPPFTWEWNTHATPDGKHVLEIIARDEAGATVIRRVTRVRVANAPAPAANGKAGR